MQQPLRILVVHPLYGGSLSIGQYCAMALKEMGHTVDVFDAPAFQGSYQALRGLGVAQERLEQLETSFVNMLSQAVHARAESFRPDLVLAMAQAPLNRQVLRRFQKDGIPTAMWFVEDYTLFTYWRAFAPFYDFFFVIQQEPFLTRLKEAGVDNAMYLPLAALPSFHQPMELTAAEKYRYSADIGFMGAGYPNRRAGFRPLVRHNFKIWGSDWEGESILAACIQNEGRRISPEESLLIYNATAVNLNLHSSVKPDTLVSGGGDFVNPRTFELAGMGAFQLVDRRTLMDELYLTSEAAARGLNPLEEDLQAELAVFSDAEGMERSIAFFLAHPEVRAEMARRARERTLREHTYEARMTAMIDFIRERRPGWPEDRRPEGLPEEMDPETRDQLMALLNRLDLPPDADFRDVITRLRQESGVLGSLETTLLFLDEWRKQYAPSS